MFIPVEARTADEAWGTLADLLLSGRQVGQASRAGDTHEILRTAVSISDPRQRWVASRLPPLNPAFAVAELVWMLAGRSDSKFVNFFNKRLPQFAGTGPTYHGAYGHRLRRHAGVDQLHDAAAALRSDPDSRQVVLQVWDAGLDLPTEDGLPKSPDVPCNIFSMLKIRGGALEWTQVSRSHDVFLGFTYDVAVFTMLHEILSGWCGARLGSFNLLSDSMHVYDRNLSMLRTRDMSVLPPVTQDLSLPQGESEKCIRIISQVADRLIAGEMTADQSVHAVDCASLPVGYDDLLRVLVADGLCRLQQPLVAAHVMSRCTCECLRTMWMRWAPTLGLVGSECANT